MPRHLARLALALLLVVLAAGATPPRGGAGAAVAAPAAPALYTVTDLGTLGGLSSGALGINDAGQVVGWATTTEGWEHAFRWSGGAMTDLGGPPGFTVSTTVAINAAGDAVGTSFAAAARGQTSAVLYRGGVARDLRVSMGEARDINDAGQVVGAMLVAPASAVHPFLWSERDGVRDLGVPDEGGRAVGINNVGQVVGWYSPAGANRAFLWSAAGGTRDLGTLPGFAWSGASDVNDAGQVVGSSVNTDGGRAFLWSAAGGMRDLGTLPGQSPGASRSEANAINDAGLVVGASGPGAVLWDAAGQPHNLNDFLPAGSGWVLGVADGINARGQIVGTGEHNGQLRAYLLTPRFADLDPGTPYLAALLALADRGIVKGYGDGRVGPGDDVARAQVAAVLARALGWDAEDWPDTTFPDQGVVDNALWRNVRALVHYHVARGYPDGTYNPTGLVTEQQVILFIARAMLVKGLWQPQADTDPYPNLPQDSARALEDRAAVVAYVRYAGAAPDRQAGQPWATWDRPAARAWVAQALWRALTAPASP